MSTLASARVPLPSDTPPLLSRDSWPGLASKVGRSQTALPCPGAEKLDPGKNPCLSPSLTVLCLLPCALFLPCSAFFCSCVCVSLLPASWPQPPCCAHLPLSLPSFPPSLPFLLPCSVKCRADIPWELWPAWGLHLSSPLDLRPRMGPPHLPLSCALRAPTQSRPPEAAGFQDVVALCELQAGPWPSQPNGGAGGGLPVPHWVQGSLARDLQVSWKLLLGWASCLWSFPCLVGLLCHLPFLMPWKLPEPMVTTWMLPLCRCPCSGISTELLLEGP